MKAKYDDFCSTYLLSMVNEGHDADTAESFAECMSSANGVTNVLVFCGSIEGKLAEPSANSKIKDISLCHQFDFHDDGILVRKMASIGVGRKESELKPIKAKPTYNCKLYNAEKLQNFQPLKKNVLPYVVQGTSQYEKEVYAEDVSNENFDSVQTGALFTCPNPICRQVLKLLFSTSTFKLSFSSAEYVREDNRRQHVINGVCKIQTHSVNTANFVKTFYISK